MKMGLIMVVMLFISSAYRLPGADGDIRLNSLGFLTGTEKIATVITVGSRFTVIQTATGATVYSGTLTGPRHQEDIDQDGWLADFSEVNSPGRYYLDVPGVGRSIDFEIGATVYDFAYYTAMRGFYLWRCGSAVAGDHNGLHYAHDACHIQDALRWTPIAGHSFPILRCNPAGLFIRQPTPLLTD